MASTPMTAAPPDQNSCRPLRPNGNNISIEASPTPATTRPTWISEGRDLVPPLKVAVTKIDTAGSTHPKSTRGRGRRALASKATSAMRHANEPTRRWGSTAKANPLDTTIDPGSTSRRSRRLIAPIRDVCHAPSEDAEIMTTNARSSLWGGETGWCYQDLNCEVIHVSCTTLADPQRTPHRLATPPESEPAPTDPSSRRCGSCRPDVHSGSQLGDSQAPYGRCRRVHTASVVTPDLDRRREETRDQQGDQHGFGDGTEEETSEDGTDDRSSRHGEYEAFVGAKACEAAVAAVAGERYEHGGQGNGEGEAAGDLDVDGEQQHGRGDEQLTPATPIRAATMPMPTPAASPSRV